MGGEWRETRLGQEVDLLTGFPFESPRYVDDPSAPRLLRGDNLAQGRLRWDGAKRWPTTDADDLNAFQLREGDVILAMDRPWIEAGLKYASVRRLDLPALLVQRVARLRGGERLDTGFLKHLIGSRSFIEHVLAVQTGTAVPHISGEQIKGFTFRLPPVAEQRAIAQILGALDDKIDLNRQLSETLEAMARALFKSWFVDFDPVRAKAEGRDPGLRDSIADLFPNSFDDSSSGEVPKGWRVARVDEVAMFQRGFDITKATQRPGRVPVVSSGGISSHHDKAAVAGPGVILGRKGVVGSVFWVEEDYWPHDTTLWVKDFFGGDRRFVYYLFRHMIPTIALLDVGSANPTLNRNHLHSVPIVLPPPAVRSAFGMIAAATLNRQEGAERESRTLAALRDTLLPKLISGELRIPDAEGIVGEVA